MQTATPPADQAQTSPTSLPPDVFGALLAALGVPADQVTPEVILNAAQALQGKAAKVDELTASLTDCQAKLATMEADAATRQSADLDNELAGYDLPPETATVVRGLPPEQRKPLLAAFPKKAATAAAAPLQTDPAKPAAPAPVHNPKATPNPEANAAEGDKLISTIRKEPGSKFATYEAARGEAKRRKPELFS